jgi:hypothetical protein
MLFAAIDAYSISLFLHVTAVVVGFGSTFAESVTFPVAMKLDPRHLPYVHRLQLTLNRYFATPALVVVLATGMYQTADADWGFGSFWISATFVIVLLIGGILGGYFIPTDRRLEAMAAKEIAAAGDGPVTMSAEYQAQARREGAIGALLGVLLIAAIFLMITKPGA